VAELLGLVISLALVAFVLLPVLSFLRLGRLARDLEELSERVGALERASRDQSQTAPTPAPTTPGWEAAPDAPSRPYGRPDVPPAAPAIELTAKGPAGDAPASEAASTSPPIASRPEEAAYTGSNADDLEDRIGGRGLLYTGVVVLLFGVSFFLKYAFDNAWVDERARVVLGFLGGLALVAFGRRLAARDLAAFGHALCGTGLAVLYLAIYAATHFYGLISQPAAFGAMTLVTIGASALADGQRAQSLAFIAVGAGFVTPFLVGREDSNQLALFTYDAILIAGTLVLALRRQWVALNGAAYVLTVLTVATWMSVGYRDDEWLRTLLFLTLFCVLFLLVLRETIRNESLTARVVALGLATAPVLYHVTAVVIAASHPPAIHIYLIAFTAAGLWLSAEPHRPWVRLAVLFGGYAPLFGAMTLPDGLSWTAPNVVTIVAIAMLNLMAVLDRVLRQQEALHKADLVALHAAGLGLFALLYTALQPIYPGLRGALAASLALGAAGLWRLLGERDVAAARNAAALAFTLVALGVAVQFDGRTVVIGWAAEGAALAWVGLRTGQPLFHIGGLALWALAALRLSDGYAATPTNFTPIVNERAFASLFVIAMGYALAWLSNRTSSPYAGRMRAALHVAASTLTLIWITAEIGSFWEIRQDSPQAYLYEHMMLSLAWGIYGAVLIALGMRRAYAPVRYIGMAVLAMTILKVFFYDLWELGGIYRVIGFIGFGIVLLLVSYLYQEGRKARRSPEPPTVPPTDDHATTGEPLP
jgi:uncharacterized membrane protein